jgi:hypothetical protein
VFRWRGLRPWTPVTKPAIRKICLNVAIRCQMMNQQATKQDSGHAAAQRASVLWWAAVTWGIVSMIGLVVSLAMMRIDRSDEAAAGAANLRALWPFWLSSASAWSALTAMWLLLRRKPPVHSQWSAVAVIFAVALAARVAVLLTHEPALSDDVYRYLFEGRTFASGSNPYAVRAVEREGPAADGQENFAGEREVLKLMTYHELATPYLPASHLVFGGLGWIVNHGWADPHSSALVFRTAYTIVEFMLITLLLVAVRMAGRCAWWVALYAWHPLPIAEIAGSGHQDVIGILVMVAGFLCFAAQPGAVARWAALVGLAVVVKPVAAVAGLFLTVQRRRMHDAFKAVATASAVVIALTSFFWLLPSSGKTGFDNWRRTVTTLGEKWAHFGGVYEPVLFVVRKLDPAEGRYAGYNLVQETRARRMTMGLLGFAIAALVVGMWKRQRKRAGLDEPPSSIADDGRRSPGMTSGAIMAWRFTAAGLLALVVFTTTAHPWYLLWAFALAPLAMNWPLWILSLTISWGYVVFVTGKGYAGGEEWTVPPWVIAAAYGPVAAACVAALVNRARR